MIHCSWKRQSVAYGDRAGDANSPKAMGSCSLQGKSFLPFLTVFVGGQEQVCADRHTGVIDFSNKQLLQLHESWCCADCFPSCRSMWLHSCPCSAILGWLVASSGSNACSCPPQGAGTHILGGFNQWFPDVCGELSHQGKVAALKTVLGNFPAHLPVGAETEVIFALSKSIFEP